MCSGVLSFFFTYKTLEHGRVDGFVKSGFTRIQRRPKLLFADVSVSASRTSVRHRATVR